MVLSPKEVQFLDRQEIMLTAVRVKPRDQEQNHVFRQ